MNLAYGSAIALFFIGLHWKEYFKNVMCLQAAFSGCDNKCGLEGVYVQNVTNA